MDGNKKKVKSGLPLIFAIIPVVLFFVEIVMIVFSAISTLVDWDASIIPGLLSIVGIFLVPITSFVFEIIGLIVSIRRKLKLFIIIYIVEIVLTILSCIIFKFILGYWFLLIWDTFYCLFTLDLEQLETKKFASA